MKQINKLNVHNLKFAARTFSMFRHPERMSIIDLLERKGSLNVQQITKLMSYSYPDLSTYLSLLLRYNIVSKTRRGQYVYYSLNSKTIEKIIQYSEELSKSI